jgi:HD-GYP domain-containing protein (c-di-GMP phosphodiesterase class II)
MTNPNSLTFRVDPSEIGVRCSTPDVSWTVLERFVQTLREGWRRYDRDPETLSAICEATEADLVFFASESTAEVLGSFGEPRPSHGWSRQLMSALLADLPNGGIWTGSAVEGLREEIDPFPSAAMLLPARGSRPSWLVVVSFDDSRQFTTGDLRVARVILQLYLDQDRTERVQDRLKETLFGVVRCLTAAIDSKDPYTCGHSERVARIAVRLGEEMGLNRGDTSDLYLAGLLHDLGKIGIPDAVLCKEGPLTPEEYLSIQEHPVIGERIIANVTKLAYLRPGIRGHHERFDGEGYPDRLKGEAIPKIARILAVADACDAMMSNRRYRSALSESRIVEIFREGAGTQWDPSIVRHFLNCRHELFSVIQRGLGQSVYFAIERAVNGAETLTVPRSTHHRQPVISQIHG